MKHVKYMKHKCTILKLFVSFIFLYFTSAKNNIYLFIHLFINIKSYMKYSKRKKRKRLRSTDKIKHSIDVATAEMTSIHI